MKDTLPLPFDQVADARDAEHKPITKKDGAHEGARRRDEGIAAATLCKEEVGMRDDAAFLAAILKSENQESTTDDSVDDLALQFADGGKWRGASPLRLARMGIIEDTGRSVRSCRPSRNATKITVWRLRDRAKAEDRLGWLTIVINALDRARAEGLL